MKEQHGLAKVTTIEGKVVEVKHGRSLKESAGLASAHALGPSHIACCQTTQSDNSNIHVSLFLKRERGNSGLGRQWVQSAVVVSGDV